MQILTKTNMRATLLGMRSGDVVDFPVGMYAETSLRSAANFAKRQNGLAFSVRKSGDTFRVVCR